MAVTFEIGSTRLCDLSEVGDYVAMMNGIAKECHDHDFYCEGNRNWIAVDLTVGARMLGLDPFEVLDAFVKENLIDPNLDDEDTRDRIERVDGYDHAFDWDWMIEPDYFVGYYRSNPVPSPVEFRLV